MASPSPPPPTHPSPLPRPRGGTTESSACNGLALSISLLINVFLQLLELHRSLPQPSPATSARPAVTCVWMNQSAAEGPDDGASRIESLGVRQLRRDMEEQERIVAALRARQAQRQALLQHSALQAMEGLTMLQTLAGRPLWAGEDGAEAPTGSDGGGLTEEDVRSFDGDVVPGGATMNLDDLLGLNEEQLMAQQRRRRRRAKKKKRQAAAQHVDPAPAALPRPEGFDSGKTLQRLRELREAEGRRRDALFRALDHLMEQRGDALQEEEHRGEPAWLQEDPEAAPVLSSSHSSSPSSIVSPLPSSAADTAPSEASEKTYSSDFEDEDEEWRKAKAPLRRMPKPECPPRHLAGGRSATWSPHNTTHRIGQQRKQKTIRIIQQDVAPFYRVYLFAHLFFLFFAFSFSFPLFSRIATHPSMRASRYVLVTPLPRRCWKLVVRTAILLLLSDDTPPLLSVLRLRPYSI
eukprot:gene1286-739_t